MSRLLLLVCLVLAAEAHDPRDTNTRIRRSRNYYGPSQRFYKPPPNVYPVRGPFSYTPPPGYGTDGPPGYRPKVSKRHNSGLGEEDLHNIVKYLSKQDLDKIFELARKKGRYSDDSDYQKFNDSPSNYKESKPIGPMYTDDDDFQSTEMYNGPYNNYRPRPKGFEHDPMPNLYNNKEYLDQPPRAENIYSQPPLETDVPMPSIKGFKDDPNPNIYNNDEYLDRGLPKSGRFYSQAPLDGNESKVYQNISPLDEYIDKVIADDLLFAKENVEVTKASGEWTPEPMKDFEPMRDFEIAFTNKSPKIVKSESSSYKLENFADLPLMNYDSKLDTVNSYNVPHYTVTSHQSQSQPPTNPFTQSSAGRDQSDAHLKAIKIWTHKSKGAAYTLHDDGTLSPERPSRPKF